MDSITIRPIHLDLETVRPLLAKALEERGKDFVYERPDWASDCMYLNYDESEYLEYVMATSEDDDPCFEGAPTPDKPVGAGCIVGYVLIEAGLSMSTLADYEGDDAQSIIWRLAEVDELSFEESVRLALNEAQAAQDRGEPWGKAVEAFDAEIKRHHRSA